MLLEAEPQKAQRRTKEIMASILDTKGNVKGASLLYIV